MIEIALWDTEHFGMKVGNLYIDGKITKEKLCSEMEVAKEEGYDLLYLKNVTLPEDCLQNNIVLADEKVEYVQITTSNQYPSSENVISYLNRELNVKLLSLALQSGGKSRYFIDKNVPINVYLTLYQTWIADSLNGRIATDVLVYKDGDDILGLLTYRQTEEKVVIGLVDVDKSSIGKGLGTKLMQTFLTRFPEGTKIEVATQKRNSDACHYYEKNGFTINSITNIYHLWPKL